MFLQLEVESIKGLESNLTLKVGRGKQVTAKRHCKASIETVKHVC